MGNNTSTSTRKSTASGLKPTMSDRAEAYKNLDEEFSDLILHKVKTEPLSGTTPVQPESSLDTSIQEEDKHGTVTLPTKGSGLVPVLKSQAQPDLSPGWVGDSTATTNTSTIDAYAHQPTDRLLHYRQFLNDLLEDEFNEVHDGLLDSDEAENEVHRNIIRKKEEDEEDSAGNLKSETDVEMSIVTEGDDDIMAVDDVEPSASDRDEMDRDVSMPDLSNVDGSRVGIKRVDEIIQQHVQQQQLQQNPPQMQQHPQNKTIPIEIKWVNANNEHIHKVSIIGSFSNWRDVLRLKRSTKHPNEYVTTMRLPLGVHKLLYIVNNEYRVSDQLPTATDQEGIFFNWFEVIDDYRLFNHSQNQPIHQGASTEYDANIVQQPSVIAGEYEVNKIREASHSFLEKMSKDFEEHHVEYAEHQHQQVPPEHHNHQLQPPSNQQQPGHLVFQPQPPRVPLAFEGDLTSLNNSTYARFDASNSSLVHHASPNKPLEYSSEIPEMFLNYSYFKENTNFELTEPPQLPAQLNNVLLNKMSNQHQNMKDVASQTVPVQGRSRPQLKRSDSSYYASNKDSYHLAIPNHVILNHLMTTLIKNDVLTVACITRYSGKFVTQIMHSPAEQSKSDS